MTDAPPRIAALVALRSGEADALLAGFAADRRRAGRRIRGLRQEMRDCDNGCQVVLVDLDDGSLYPITQDLGAGSESCALDPGLLAEASVVLRRIAAEGAELAVFNRYSNLEAEGGGFAAEMLDLMSRGIPVLTIVPERRLADWHRFTGGFAVDLPVDRAALDAWFDSLPRTGG